MPQKWSKEIVARRIRAMRRGGKKLNSDYVQKHDSRLYQAACTWWGGWRQAIEGAGLSYDSVRIHDWRTRTRVWSKKIIIAAIRKMHRDDEPLNSNHIQTKHKRLYGAACRPRYFGGWPQAVAAAGFNYEKLRKQKLRSWSKEAIVNEIIRRSALGLSIKAGEVQAEDHGLFLATGRHFGKRGWRKARVLAGFTPVDRRKWDKKKICTEIKKLHDSEVLLNTGAMMSTPEYRRLLSSARNIFKSWAKAIRAAGLDYNKIRKSHPVGWWTRKRILKTIKSLERKGVRLSSKSIQLSGGGLFPAAVETFGSWGQAVEAAGINYREHCRTWSTKAWLRRMSKAEYKKKISAKS